MEFCQNEDNNAFIRLQHIYQIALDTETGCDILASKHSATQAWSALTVPSLPWCLGSGIRLCPPSLRSSGGHLMAVEDDQGKMWAH